MVQDAFAAFIAKQGTAAEIKSPESYLYTTVKHRCLEYFRNLRIADRHMQKQAEALLFSFADDGNIDENDEIKMKVGAALAELSPQQRTVVELHILQGMRYQDIAKHLAISENSVRTHLKRAYRVLRSNLASILPFVFL